MTEHAPRLSLRPRRGAGTVLSPCDAITAAVRRLVPGVIAATAAACAAPGPSSGDAARQQWIVNTLAADNLVYELRDPAMLAGKLIRMQSAPHAWMRGTAAIFWRDLTGPGPWAAPSAYADAASDRVLVLGDPHVENLGTFRPPDGALEVDWNDFDAAGYGPYWGDVRRLAVATVMVARDRFGADADADGGAAAVASAIARGYAGEIARLADGAPAPPVADGFDPILDHLLAKAADGGAEGARLADYTRVDGNGDRAMFFGDVEPPADDGTWIDTVVEVGADRAMIDRAIAAWRPTVLADAPAAAFAIKGASRRLGAGISSYAALRYYVLLEGPTASADDDWLVEVKETVDGPRLPGPPAYATAFTSAGQRVVAAQLRTGARVDADDLLGWADLGPTSFRIRNRTGYQKGLDEAKLIDSLDDGAAGVAELTSFATVAGVLLARAHSRAATLDGDAAAPAIAAHLSSPAAIDGFVAETAAFAVAYADRTIADWQTFSTTDLAAELYP